MNEGKRLPINLAREVVRYMFGMVFAEYDKDPDLAFLLEKSIYDKYYPCNKSRKIQNIENTTYYHIVVQLYSHLNPKMYLQNKYLIHYINKENITNVVNMKKYELFPSAWKLIDKVYKSEKQFETRLQKPRKVPGQICSCGCDLLYYSQAQLRSADEPMTTFITCSYCDKQWKF